MVGEWLHYSVVIGPVTMEFGRSGWGRVGVIQHHLVAKLEERAVIMGFVEVGCRMALSPTRCSRMKKRVCSMRSAANCGCWVVGCGMRGNW